MLVQGVSSMSVEDNKALVRRVFQEFWVQKNLAVSDELIAPNHRVHGPRSHVALPPGPEGHKQSGLAFFTAFPDLQSVIVEQVAEGDTVVTLWTTQGTHTGSMLGMPATNKVVTFSGITIDHIADGKIVESWTHFDNLGMLQQIGILPQWPTP
jgi:predicted ester cyclase